MPKNLAVFNDGTLNDPSDEHITNIYKLYKACVKDKSQQALYLAGVGNEQENNWLGKFFGGVFGFGADAKKDQAVEWVKERYEPGDSVFIFGYSRGASGTRLEANELSAVAFMGCFDTVGAFGIPNGPFQKINLFKDMHVGTHVKNVLHLVSLDETRPEFKPTLMNKRHGIEEIWLPGVHSDIGGGSPNSNLSDCALELMANASVNYGLRLKPSFVNSLTPDYEGIVHYNTDYPLGAEPRNACVQVNDKPTQQIANLHRNAIKRMGKNYWPLAWLPTNFKGDK